MENLHLFWIFFFGDIIFYFFDYFVNLLQKKMRWVDSMDNETILQSGETGIPTEH